MSSSLLPAVKSKNSGTPVSLPSFSALDYGKFLVAGGLCATITHGMMTPIDVVKTRIQLEGTGAKIGMLTMAKDIVKAEGPQGLLTGFGATAIGYLIQGGLKFGLYEFWKRQFIVLAGTNERAQANRTAIYLVGASAAEIIATTALTPLEAARIRMVSERGYATNLFAALGKMTAQEGVAGLYAGYIPILFKQVPYAIGQFTTNEWMHEVANKTIPQDTLEKAGKAGEIGVQLGCGVVAGVAAAVLSHPADTLLSKINKGGGGGESKSTIHKLVTLAQETGPVRIWAGLGPRILMTSGLVAGQFLLFAEIKKALGAPAGVEIHKTT